MLFRDSVSGERKKNDGRYAAAHDRSSTFLSLSVFHMLPVPADLMKIAVAAKWYV
jgi:hypothetical protein